MRIKSIFTILFLVSFVFIHNFFAADMSKLAELSGEKLAEKKPEEKPTEKKEPVKPADKAVTKLAEEKLAEKTLRQDSAEQGQSAQDNRVKEKTLTNKPTKKTAEKIEKKAPRQASADAKAMADKQGDRGEELAIEGLDTVSVKEPEGNWLLKRIWWEKAKKKYAKIKRFASKIADLQLGFVEKRNNINRDVFDPFYVEVGLEYGQLKEVVSSLVQNLKELREKEGSLDAEEKEFLSTLESESKTLEQLELDVKSIRKLNAAIDSDIRKLIEQINRSRRYEDDALKIFFDIAKVLSHKKARELYYQMDSLWKNIKSIDAYIRGKFLRHFDTVIENAKTQVERIKNVAAAFKDKGIDLKKQFAKYANGAPKPEKKALEKKEPALRPFDKLRAGEQDERKKDEKPEEKKTDEEEIEEEPVGWLGSIWNAITWPFRKFWGLFG